MKKSCLPAAGARACLFLALACGSAPLVAGTESIEFVTEHLAEIPMDNRFASLPIWIRPTGRDPQSFAFGVQAAFARTRSNTLTTDGPMLSLGMDHGFHGDWKLMTFGFYDDLNFSCGVERRPLDVKFASGVPLALPAESEFTGLNGSMLDAGVGIALGHASHLRLWNSYEWRAGVIWQRVTLRDYSLKFNVLEGASTGATGTVDYDATYEHVTPFVALAWPRARDHWNWSPHVQLAVPLPRRGYVGHIQGPGYDISGDTGTASGDTPFGDISVTIGFDVTYNPWNLTVDVGSVLTQALVEPVVHKGVEQNWMLSAGWDF